MKKNNRKSSSLLDLLRNWMHTALEQIGAIIEESEWFPGSRFSRIP